MMIVKIANTDSELEKISSLLLQLRQNYNKENLIQGIKEQIQHGYQIAYVELDNQILCVAGFVISHKLAWGKHIYIDDLVTDDKFRSQGAGKFILDWFKSYAKENNCKQIQLDSGIQRFKAHKFYLREGFVISSHHFSMTDIG